MKNNQSKRKYYLENIPLKEAIDKFNNSISQSGFFDNIHTINIPLEESLGKITSKPIWALESSPHYDSAGMDGIAVKASTTNKASEKNPVELTENNEYIWVDTGNPLPKNKDAVIMIEHVNQISNDKVQIFNSIPPYENVRRIGEDIVATEMLLPKSHKIRPIDIGACASSGIEIIEILTPPKIAIFPTGSELVPYNTKPKSGQIKEFNSLIIESMIKEWGGQAYRYPPIIDEFETIKDIILKEIHKYDILIINAGSSAGSKDYTAKIVESLGKLIVHGTAIKPGHPIVLGLINKTPIIGLPGYPVSTALTCDLFIKPMIEKILKNQTNRYETIHANITRKIASSLGEDEYIRVNLGIIDKKIVATPIKKGAGIISSLVKADGIILIPRFSEGLHQGEKVQVELLKNKGIIEKNILVSGSHDIALDLISSYLNPKAFISSSNIGSIGGLITLSRNESHIAGIHLLDEITGDYNISFAKKYLNNKEKYQIVNLAYRTQGFIVQRNNPKGIKSLQSLINKDIRFINRQKGSGTRILLDYKLKEENINPQNINGYDREEYTHLAVGAAILSKTADVGLGIYSSAVALGLDFIPLAEERYDLIIPDKIIKTDKIQSVLELLNSKDFKIQVENLGGYNIEHMGKLIEKIG